MGISNPPTWTASGCTVTGPDCPRASRARVNDSDDTNDPSGASTTGGSARTTPSVSGKVLAWPMPAAAAPKAATGGNS